MKDIRDIIHSLPPMVVDEEVNVHHCKEGKDNDRLYIKRTARGWLYHCFHCGKSGGVSASAAQGTPVRASNAATHRPVRDNVRTDRVPSDCTADWGQWHPRARVWVGKYVTQQEVRDNGLLYSPSLRRVVLPVHDSDGLVGYQTRKIFDEDFGPKYKTYTARPQDFYLHRLCVDDPAPVVLVEDFLSAVKCARVCSSAALFGTTLKDNLLARLVRMHRKYLIFLDNDNPMVKSSQRKIKSRLDIFGECVILKAGVDPKELSTEELEEHLK